MILGVIADDFTGATDIAGFLVDNGLSTLQLTGVPNHHDFTTVDAVVISLKSRSCPAAEAVAVSLEALAWLRAHGCQRIYQKYCSTFDSTAFGNIGPVTDALLDALNCDFTLICPSLPINGRTVYQGHLFVDNELLSESGMSQHPLTPMLDSHLIRLMDAQADGKTGLVPFTIVEQGPSAITRAFTQLQAQQYRYAVVDTLSKQHLLDIAETVLDWPLVTGGSGLAMGLAHHLRHHGAKQARTLGYPTKGRCVILSGSCSSMTQRQVAQYQTLAPSLPLSIEACLNNLNYPEELARYVVAQNSEFAPLIYATTTSQQLKLIQQQYGQKIISEAIESCFATLAQHLITAGFINFIIAGGETSGRVTQALEITAFHIGPQIAPGVPWVRATDHTVSLALKSGNFGDEHFFFRAQEFLL